MRRSRAAGRVNSFQTMAVASDMLESETSISAKQTSLRKDTNGHFQEIKRYKHNKTEDHISAYYTWH